MRNKSTYQANDSFYVLVFNWNHFEMRLLNLRINFFIADFFPHLGSLSCVVSSFTTTTMEGSNYS